MDSVPIWGLDPVSVCASTDVQFEPDSSLIPNLPLELQRLLYDSNTRVTREAWDVFYRQNSFSIRKPESLLFRSLGLYQQDPSLDFAPKAWIRTLFMNIEIGDRDNFLHSLLCCPSFKKVVFWMHGHDDTFRYLEQNFTVVAHASAMLRAKLGEGFKFLVVNQFYGDWESGLVRGARELRTDMAWLLSPSPEISQYVHRAEHAGVAFKDMIPFQLAKISVLICEFKDRDREQDGMVRMLVSLALVLTLETSDTKDDSLALLRREVVKKYPALAKQDPLLTAHGLFSPGAFCRSKRGLMLGFLDIGFQSGLGEHWRRRRR